MNIRTTVTGSVADIERCAGRCKQAASTTEDETLQVYLCGAANALLTLIGMEYGDNEERFLTRLMIPFEEWSKDEA